MWAAVVGCRHVPGGCCGLDVFPSPRLPDLPVLLLTPCRSYSPVCILFPMFSTLQPPAATAPPCPALPCPALQASRSAKPGRTASRARRVPSCRGCEGATSMWLASRYTGACVRYGVKGHGEGVACRIQLCTFDLRFDSRIPSPSLPTRAHTRPQYPRLHCASSAAQVLFRGGFTHQGGQAEAVAAAGAVGAVRLACWAFGWRSDRRAVLVEEQWGAGALRLRCCMAGA